MTKLSRINSYLAITNLLQEVWREPQQHHT